ncbi:HD domain-containing protein [Persicobacter psychrovividus]|uniref:Phosphohydrolase n=1 Tax=Persicobacter psychrovividus TaxID=387638 RepID=A0ABN6L7Q8_9BACT|nr:phosphohydrolase [Persicobacter psychrovividus]
MKSKTVQEQAWIDQTAAFVKSKFEGEGTGHDWWHIYRVWKNAQNILDKKSNMDAFVVEMGALLHDIADFKFHDGDESVGPKEARKYLHGLGVEPARAEAIVHIVEHVSYKGAKVANKMKSEEGFVVQDADRLDAIGAIGVARTFAYGGSVGSPMHDPSATAELHEDFEAYKNSRSSTVNHFYEKLLLLKDMMNTPEAKAIAEGRHAYMEQFLQTFYNEWEGKQ